MERSFDKKATFRGRVAIQKYWKYQICGKQSNVSFRHVDSEMVRDADSPIAVVKWLAEFENRREKRADKAYKRVRFCQMAKLHFEECPTIQEAHSNSDKNDGPVKMRISYLEEYAQGVEGKNFQWPGLDATADELWDKIRFEAPKPPPRAVCNKCDESFPSRKKLFEHIKFTDPQYDSDDKCICVPNEDCRRKMLSEHVFVCLSVSHWCDDPQERLIRAWKDARSRLISDDDISREAAAECEPKVTLTWAVPTELISSAVVNVVTMKLPKVRFEQVGGASLLPEILNVELTQNHSIDGTSSSSTTFLEEKCMMMVHTAGIVDRPCSPERRDFELYAAYFPWDFFDNQRRRGEISTKSNSVEDEDAESNVIKSPRKLVYIPKHKLKQGLISTEQKDAFEVISSDSNMVQRLKHGGRLIKEWGHLGMKPGLQIEDEPDINLNRILSVKTCAMNEPLHHYCKILISVKQTVPGYIKRLFGLLCAFARFELSEDNFIASLKDRAVNISAGASGLSQYQPEEFPSDYVVMLEPAMTKFENKTKLKLCPSGKTKANMSENMEASIEKSRQVLIGMIVKKEAYLDQWIGGSGGIEQQ